MFQRNVPSAVRSCRNINITYIYAECGPSLHLPVAELEMWSLFKGSVIRAGFPEEVPWICSAPTPANLLSRIKAISSIDSPRMSDLLELNFIEG